MKMINRWFIYLKYSCTIAVLYGESKMEQQISTRKRLICLIGAFLILSTCSWKQLWSITFNPLISDYGFTAQSLAGTYSTYALLATVLMLAGGKLIDHFGTNIIIISGAVAYLIGEVLPGIIHTQFAFALGYILFLSWADNVVYIGTFENLSAVFHGRRGLVMSLAAVGMSAGEIALPPFSQKLITSYGLSIQFFVVGILLCLACLIGLVMCPGKKRTQRTGEDDSEENAETEAVVSQNSDFIQKDWKMMLKDIGFWLYFILVIFSGITGIMLISQCSWMAQDIIKISPTQGAWLVSALAVSMFFGKLFWGWLGDKIGRLNLLILMFIVMTVAMIGIVFSGEGRAVQFIGCMLVGVFSSGGLSGVTPAIVSDMFGTKHFALNFSIVMCALPIGQAAVPWIANIAARGNYVLAFSIEVIVAAAGVALAIALKKAKTGKLDIS